MAQNATGDNATTTTGNATTTTGNATTAQDAPAGGW
jgi:hypothetical protein